MSACTPICDLSTTNMITWTEALGAWLDTLPWKLDLLPAATSSIVVSIRAGEGQKEPCESLLKDVTTAEGALNFLLTSFREGQKLVKLLVPAASGYVIQSDFLGRRMVDCLHVAKAQSFLQPGQHVKGLEGSKQDSPKLLELLSCCYGAVAVQSEDESPAIDEELTKRLSFNWLTQSPVPRKRVAMIGGASVSKLSGFAVAAASLNIALVVFDEPGSWVASDAYTHLREQTIVMDMTPDSTMSQRIANALLAYQKPGNGGNTLDGVMTLDEHLLTIVSRAAQLAGFKTSPPESVGMAQNKFQTRQLDSNVYCRLLRSPADLEAMIAEDGPRLPYPLIVKPSKGWSSEGVWKVANEQELRNRVPMLWQEGFTAWHGHDVVVETYVEGPEVDANLVLADGELVFFEVNDDFPSSGDYDDPNEAAQSPTSVAPVANFVETSNMLPSALSPKELTALQQRLHELALKAGFRDGVLHIEAKLRNSSSRYAKDTEGLVDLRRNAPDEEATAGPEDVFLLEINPRQPGWQEVEATAHAYGVSYYSLAVLHALGDRERIVALSRPFVGGAQYHMQLLFVAAQKGGVYRHGDVCAAVLEDLKGPDQDLSVHVAKCFNLMEDGQEVPDPSTGQVYGNFIAFFLVMSRNSRQEALRIGREIENRVRVLTDGF